MRRVAGGVLVVFAASLSFGDAFAPHPWVPLPMLVLLSGLAVAGLAAARVPATRVWPGYFGVGDLLLVGFVVLLIAGVLLSTRPYGKNFNHAIAYLSVVGLFAFGLRGLFALDGAGLWARDRLLLALSLTTVMVAALALVEFADVNFLHLGLTRLIWFPRRLADYNPQFYIFTRARGLEAESGFLALYLNLFGPLAIVVLRQRLGAWPAAAAAACLAGGFLVTFSAAGGAALALGAVAAGLAFLGDRRLFRLRVLPLLLAMAGVVLVVGAFAVAPPEVREALRAKLTLASGASAGERVRAWTAALDVAGRHPWLGVGVGTTSATSGTGVISLYLTIIKEAGVLALALFLGYLGLVAGQAIALPASGVKYALLAGLVAGAVHYAVIANIWYPWLWMLVALVTNESVRARAGGGATPA